jgi:hypothetical protein
MIADILPGGGSQRIEPFRQVLPRKDGHSSDGDSAGYKRDAAELRGRKSLDEGSETLEMRGIHCLGRLDLHRTRASTRRFDHEIHLGAGLRPVVSSIMKCSKARPKSGVRGSTGTVSLRVRARVTPMSKK